MAHISRRGTPTETVGDLPAVGTKAPGFTLTGHDLADVTQDEWSGRRLVLNIFPSIDTATCATSVRTFNALASTLENTTVLCVSNDLPMAQNRFCGAEGLSNVATASGFRSDFGDVCGVRILDGGTSHEPDYDAAITVL